jgi:hypothetical protein
MYISTVIYFPNYLRLAFWKFSEAEILQSPVYAPCTRVAQIVPIVPSIHRYSGEVEQSELSI